MKKNAFITITYLVAVSAIISACSGSKDASTAPTAVTGNFDIINLSAINSPEDDFAPVMLPNATQLLYTSNRKGDVSQEKIDNKSRFGEVIYIAEGSGSNWSGAKPYSTAFSKSKNHGGYALSPDGSTAYFASAYLEPNVGGSDIYMTQKTIGQWSTPVSALALNTKWWDAHPAISPDGNTIVFSSNRADSEPDVSVKGYRQPHLWISTKDASGNWTAPKPMPAPINSEFAEISPFFSSDGYLYFSTNRFENQGFDIVRSRKTPEGWSVPERMPEPVNSTSDDVFPFITNDRGAMYFASNRSGGFGGLDLYYAKFPTRIRLRGIVSLQQETSFSPAGGVPVIIENITDRKTWTVTTGSDGSYETDLDPQKSYIVKTGVSECYLAGRPAEVNVGLPMNFDTTFVRDFSISRLVFPHFQLDRYNIPFFVTGYYYPNTNANLDNLERRIDTGELNLVEGGNTPYIDRRDENYRSYASKIEAIFDTIYTSIIDSYLPMFNSCALQKEKLLVEVRGFVDPRGLTPGFYVDETVQTEGMTINKGERMAGQDGNTKLANLRAYYTLKMIDSELQKRSPRYKELKRNGRIELRAYGVGIDTETGGSRVQDPAKRRIDIRLTIID